jgi:hypothetical protein
MMTEMKVVIRVMVDLILLQPVAKKFIFCWQIT